ncbi:uncharacterized protein P174DRAFT_440949 [Aspergillus novofumigatus IBT 16806]|uniref:Uncharacterized protein n=1 Tax=Aspergillus novofumigatus (strain IBT 16806) TaxID=1392255 RepID=A0A2I1C7V7_ASPN1|nr:uncharacterized protein P174DRAFT_440949 [Aspergillus novofumigatus IBT 16806]PKX93685.1 hypothetical protein P174DRAFT_440949 [Aspergillus novofumigatus IBT 16806]
MTSNYNLRRAANPAQDQAGETAGEPDLQSQSQTNPEVQSQTNQQKSQQSSFQSSESSKQTSSNDVKWGNQPGDFSASETNPKPPGSYHFTSDQLSHPQE